MSEVNRSLLAQQWQHAHEEDQGEDLVFLPASRPLPRSRGRFGFDLSREGTMRSLEPKRDDRPGGEEGTWDLEGNVLRLSQSGRSQLFEVVSAAVNRLVLRRLMPHAVGVEEPERN